MAIFPVRSLTHTLDRKAVQEGNNLSTSIKVVIAVGAGVGFLCLILIIWRIIVWRRRSSASRALEDLSTTWLEKGPQKSFDSISIYTEVIQDRKEPTSVDEPKRNQIPLSNIPLNTGVRPLPVPGTVSLPPPAPAQRKNTRSLRMSALTDQDLLLESPVRSVSFRPPSVKSTYSMRAIGKKLPRLMTVTATYVPTLADELPIKVGETIRMIAEYEDEWCLVQRVGRTDDEKGVIPRFCLVERPDVIPRQKMGMSVNTSTFRK